MANSTRTESPPVKAAPTRMYYATDNESGAPVALINATSAAAARSHLSRRKFTVRYAEQADIIAACKASIAPENAGQETE